MPAHDYRPPAVSSARKVAFWSRVTRAVALALVVLTISLLYTAAAELSESSPAPSLVLGGFVGAPRSASARSRCGARVAAVTSKPSNPATSPACDRWVRSHPRTALYTCRWLRRRAVVVTRDGLHLPAGIDSLGRVSRLMAKAAYGRLTSKRIEVPCFLPWSQVIMWSYGTPLGRAAGEHAIELTGQRYLQFGDEVIGDETIVLLDAVRSVGAQSIEVNRAIAEDFSSTITTS